MTADERWARDYRRFLARQRRENPTVDQMLHWLIRQRVRRLRSALRHIQARATLRAFAQRYLGATDVNRNRG